MFQCDCIEDSLDSEQFDGIWTKIQERFLMPHPQQLHGTPIYFGQENHCWFQGVWKANILVGTWGWLKKKKCSPCSFLQPGLQISTPGLWTLSFPPPFLLFQALILCEEFFSPSVHMYISFLRRKMSVDVIS